MHDERDGDDAPAREPLSIESWPRLGPMLCDLGDAKRHGQRAGIEHEREILRGREILATHRDLAARADRAVE